MYLKRFHFKCVFILYLALFISHSLSAQQPANGNPLVADPTIFFDKGVYYLYGTSGRGDNEGFEVFTSTDQQNWKKEGLALKRGESYGTKGFWAPQVFKYKGKYYMAYTANEHIAIAVADHPAGPFRQQQVAPLDASVKIIDPFIWMDPSGVIYLYHVRLQKGNRIFVAEMNASLTAMNESTLKECINATDHWEDTQQVPWKVAEGPTVLKHKGWYYMIYSANDFRNPDYAIGYATSKSPIGPWKKFEGNPVISTKNTGENGTGHGDVFTDKKGQMRYVLHTHNNNTKVGPRKTATIGIRFVPQKGAPDKIEALPETFRFLNK
jgi:xylan 1,4-beta-xylosidase